MDMPNTNNTDITPSPIPIAISYGNRSRNHKPSPASNQNHNSNPFSDPVPSTDLNTVSRSGTTLITNITKYLSTLPHPIEIVEELVAVCAVTITLLTSLNSALLRFPHLNLSPEKSFIGPLCHDILFAFKLLGDRVQEAKRMRVFEPNDVGLVRLPRCAWTLVLGTEAKVAALRSRLYVEKYRVRVLIEAVNYEGLRRMGNEGRNRKEEDEMRSLGRMLPLVAERLVGVQRDYKPRLLRMSGVIVDEKMEVNEPIMRPVTMKTVVVPSLVATPPAPAPVLVAPAAQAKNVEITPEPLSEKTALASASSSPSIIHETWLLRCNRPKKDLKSRVSVLGLPVVSTHTYSSTTYYVKPSLSSATETLTLLQSCYGTQSPEQHLTALRQKVLSMADDAQWEVQKLVEARQKACSSAKVNREWEVVGLMERNRRKLSPGAGDNKWWKLKKEKKIVEWVLVLKGQTVDCDERVLPEKHEDAWKVKEVKTIPPCPPTPAVVQAQAQVQRPVAPVQQQGTVLRHIENRRVLSPDEAELKMREIIKDLFIENDEVETDSEDEEDDESEIEDEDDEAEQESEIELGGRVVHEVEKRD